MVERFAIPYPFFLSRRHHPDFLCDQIVAPLDVFNSSGVLSWDTVQTLPL